ncbi:CDT1_C domain-containing protein [Pseudozyma hubeiensis]|nr:CDT1_C domain-containing protein [Pseudozyma hubeiensis]
MAPNRGIASHFTASKASISRAHRSVKSKPVKDVATSASEAAADSASRTIAASSGDQQPKASTDTTLSMPVSPRKTPQRRQTRTRLRTPDEGEVDRIMAENESLLQSSPASRFTSSSMQPESEPLTLLGTPPTTPRASSRFSPLLEPSQTSPISVRTDPDTNKMYLMLSRSLSNKPTSSPGSSNLASSSSPTKRKLTTPPKSASPSKTPRTLTGTPRRLITGEAESLGTEEEDGLVLTPGRAKGTRVMLGSPSKSPLLSRLGDTPKAQALRRIVDEEDEEAHITPRGVRQKPKGVPLPPMATANAAAIFRGAQLPSSSSVPNLAQSKQVEPASLPLSSSHTAGLSHTEIDSGHVAEEDQVELPQSKHALASDLPLPSFYLSLLSLHVALEHALVVHLATAGCASATLESSAQSSDDEHSDSERSAVKTETKRTRTVRLPNLISYTALRPLVERSGGRRLGPTELKRLASVWVDFQRSSTNQQESSVDEDEEVRGLGFIISKTRSMDPRTGRRALDWGIGIELEIKRTVRPRTPLTQVNFGGVEVQSSPVLPSSSEGFDESVLGTPKMPSRATTPPLSERKLRSPFMQSSSPLLSSPRRKLRAASPTPLASSPKTRSSVSSAKAREGMSVVAMWNNGLETRKAEVGRRLRERCARYHQLWLDEKGISVPPASAVKREEPGVEPATPSRKREKMVGLGIASAGDSDREDDDDAPAVPPREAVMGAGGLFTPSATRSGGRRIGKRTFHMDPSEIDNAGLTDDDSDGAEGLAGPLLQGKQSLMDEVSTTVIRSSRSMPQLPISSASTTDAGELPPEGSTLHHWHSDFPLDNPSIVRPIPLATLPSLTIPLATPHRNKDKSLLPSATAPLTPQKPVKFISAVPPTPSASTAGMTLRERIAAKEQLRRTASLPSLSQSGSSLTPMQALSQRALVSRLPELCSILFMLFSNGTTLSSTGITRSPTLSMQDLLGKLAKSVKIQMSTRECRQAIDVLGRIAPGFLVVINPAGETVSTAMGKEFVRMGSNPDTGAVWRLNEVRAKIAAELNRA